MQENEKRISLTHGTAVVDKDESQETVNALNKMVECANKQQRESLRLSDVVGLSCLNCGSKNHSPNPAFDDLRICHDCGWSFKAI